MKVENVGTTAPNQADPNKAGAEAEFQAQMKETLAHFALSMAQQQSSRALQAMQEARNEDG